jgi:hypothetical protein
LPVLGEAPPPDAGPRVVCGHRPGRVAGTRRGPTWAIRWPKARVGADRGRSLSRRRVAATGDVACASRRRRRWASGRPG